MPLARLTRGGGTLDSVGSAEGLWLRQGIGRGADGDPRRACLEPDGTELGDDLPHLFTTRWQPEGRIEAVTAKLLERGPVAVEGAKTLGPDTDNPEQTQAVLAEAPVSAADRPHAGVDPRSGSARPRPSPSGICRVYIRDLERAGFSAQAYRLWYQMELALPMLMAAMVLVAAGFTMRHARFGKTGQMVLFALMGGVLHLLSAQLCATSW
jgi:lipopolysaccharide export system permease protein